MGPKGPSLGHLAVTGRWSIPSPWRTNLSKMLKALKARNEGGEPAGFGWHTLRHTFASHLAMRGTSIDKIRKYAGHANLATTQRYMHLAPGEQSAADIDKLDGVPMGSR